MISDMKRGRKRTTHKIKSIEMDVESIKYLRRLIADRVVYEIDGEFFYSRSASEAVRSLIKYVGRCIYDKKADFFEVKRNGKDESSDH